MKQTKNRPWKRMNNSLSKIISATLLAVYLISVSCSDINDPDMRNGSCRLINESDSTVLFELLQNSLDIIDMDKDKIGKMTVADINGMTYLYDHSDLRVGKKKYDFQFELRYFDDINQYKISYLQISSTGLYDPVGMDVADLPEGLKRLDRVEHLNIFGHGIKGELPDDLLCSYKDLKRIDIISTGMTKLPESLFSPDLKVVEIHSNIDLCSLPESVSSLKSLGYPETAFNITGNGITGDCPNIPDAFVNFSLNNFTGIDWNGVSRFVEDGPKIFLRGVDLEYNRIGGTIPDEVLNDTVKLWMLYISTGEQQDNIRFSNLPSADEMHKRIKEYKKNHPRNHLVDPEKYYR